MVEIKQEDNKCFSQSVKSPRTGGNKRSSMKKRSSRRDRREEEEAKEDDGSILVRIDPKVLDCSICSKPLQPPISQCKNGHVACSVCSSMVKEKCSQCSCELSNCPGLGAIINTIKISCPNSSFGCKETIPYTQKGIHDQSCPYIPCSCPVPNCTFTGPVPELNAHIRSVHLALYTPQTRQLLSSYFWCSQVLKQDEPFLVFEGDDSCLYLLLNNRDFPLGNCLSMLCIGPNRGKQLLHYELTVPSSNASNVSLQLKAYMTTTKEWKGVYPSSNFLFVPNEFCSKNRIRVFVSITK